MIELIRILIQILIISMFLSVYSWSLYNLPILVAGVRHLHRNRQTKKKGCANRNTLTFSVVIPAKNEEKVVGRLLESLSKLVYPKDKFEVLVVEDGSTDNTLGVCGKFAEKHALNMTILQKPISNGKPSALNHGLKHAKGEIIAIFDADSVPDRHSLANACKYFEEPCTAAVQGRTLSINSEENMLTRFISYEEAVWCEAYLRGKDSLNLFVSLKGSCQFVRRSVLEELKGFDEKALSEDVELSARLTEKKHKVSYAPDVRSWQESPASLRQLLRQRTRWFRGYIDVAVRYGKLMAKPDRKSLDAEVTFLAPFVIIASLLTYLGSFCVTLMPFALDFLIQFTTIATTSTVLVCSLALAYSSKPRNVKSLLWLPFIYFYWSLQAFIALHALMLTLLGRPRAWTRTEKKGSVTASAGMVS